MSETVETTTEKKPDLYTSFYSSLQPKRRVAVDSWDENGLWLTISVPGGAMSIAMSQEDAINLARAIMKAIKL